MRAASLFVAAAASALVFAARADAYLYWTHAGNDIARAANDGTQVNLRFIEGTYDGAGVAVDVNDVYWTNLSNGSIGRANLDGSDVHDHELVGPEPSALPS